MNVIRLIDVRESELSVDEVRAAVADPAAGRYRAVRRHGAGLRPRPGGHRAVLQRAPVGGGRAQAGGRGDRGEVPRRTASRPCTGWATWPSATSRWSLAVSCPHRAEAFNACRELIDLLKAWCRSGSTSGSTTAPPSGSAPRDGESSASARSVQPMSRRSLTLLIASIGTAVAIAVSVLVPVPYVILGPGPTLNTLGKDSSGKPLITIKGRASYPVSGHLNMVTVSYQGVPGRPLQHLHRAGGLAEPAPGGRAGERDLPGRADARSRPSSRTRRR